MIQVTFKTKKNVLHSVSVTGHAEYDDHGKDIVCAAVTSALQLCANAITEVVEVPADIVVKENLVEIILPDRAPKKAIYFLEALLLHLDTLQQDYPNNVQVQLSEV